MSINDPFLIFWNERYLAYMAQRGRETFFREPSRVQWVWDTPEEAREWIIENHGSDRIIEIIPRESSGQKRAFKSASQDHSERQISLWE